MVGIVRYQFQKWSTLENDRVLLSNSDKKFQDNYWWEISKGKFDTHMNYTLESGMSTCKISLIRVYYIRPWEKLFADIHATMCILYVGKCHLSVKHTVHTA